MTNAEVAEYLRVMWVGRILVEALLLAALIHRRQFSTLPYFCWFVAFAFIRAAVLFPLWKTSTWTAFGYGSLITAPVDMVLMAWAGIEAFVRFVGGHTTLKDCVGLIVPVLVAGILLPAQHVQSRAIPTWQEMLMNKIYMQRALLASLPVVIIWTLAWVQMRLPDSHAITLLVYCVLDLVTYFALASAPEWVKARPFDGALFMMAGQTCCLLAWTILFTNRQFNCVVGTTDME